LTLNEGLCYSLRDEVEAPLLTLRRREVVHRVTVHLERAHGPVRLRVSVEGGLRPAFITGRTEEFELSEAGGG